MTQPDLQKIIFLDVDGVLNNDVSGFGGFMPSGLEHYHDSQVKWAPECVALLRRLAEETGAAICVSSFWRTEFSTKDFLKFFELYGWPDAPVIGQTPVFSHEFTGQFSRLKSATSRIEEVNAWLAARTTLGAPPVTHYAVLDDMTPQEFCIQSSWWDKDDDVIWRAMEPHYVQTDPSVGLDPSTYDLARSMFPPA